MEFYRDESGVLTKLKQQNVDTGMWFERMCKVMQNKATVYESDVFSGIIKVIEKHTWVEYKNHQRRIRIVADHLRTAIVLINDGGVASNVGAGYVLRMIIRRMYYNLMLLSDQKSYAKLIEEVIEEVKKIRPAEYKWVAQALEEEINQFKKTIENGHKLLLQIMKKANWIIAGKDVFMLYDTYGFPVELTREIASTENIQIDEKWFQEAMENAREKSRQWTKDMFKKWTDRSKYLDGVPATKFIGYENITSEKSKLIKDFEVDGQRILIFDQSPFYAESWGQVWDYWTIELDGWEKLTVKEVKKYEWVFLHFVS
jgi:alanyl-tRNA synthetase